MEVSRTLGKVQESLGKGLVAAHPGLARDYNEVALKKVIDSVGKLDADAPRRASILKKLFSSTRTIFIDWKDAKGNEEVYRGATKDLKGDPMANYREKINKKTWIGVAFGNGATVIRALPGFKPNTKELRAKIDAQLLAVSKGNPKPSSMGAGTKASGNFSLVTLVHELGHHAHFKSKLQALPINSPALSIYGEVNQRERYAELFVSYIFSGPRLRELYPSDYQVVENILSTANLL